MLVRIWRLKDGAKLLQLFLHQKVGLRVGPELKSMAADDAEAVLFVEALSTRVEFPNPEPHHIAAVSSRSFETGVHEILANALAEVLLVGVEAAQFDRAFGRDALLGGVKDQLGITGRFAFYLGDQENALLVCKFGGYLLKAERLPHIVVQVVGSVFRMMSEGVPERRIGEVS